MAKMLGQVERSPHGRYLHKGYTEAAQQAQQSCSKPRGWRSSVRICDLGDIQKKRRQI